MATDKQLDELLAFDPLAEAERITGGDYKEDEETQGIGFFLLQLRSRARDNELRSRNDTVFHNEFGRYVEIIEKYGFEKVYEEPFTHRQDDEWFYVYWHPDGLLLTFETFTWHHLDEIGIGGANVHYCWRRNPDSDYWPFASSRAWCEDWDDPLSPRTLCQSLDAREALIYNLNKLRANGEFVVPWPDEPEGFSLGHYGDRDVEYNEPGWAEYRQGLRANRLARLPEHVRNAIGSVVS